MLNSTPNADFEHQRLTEAWSSDLIASATRRHGWKSDTLRGATFFVVLPEGKDPLNDRRTLQKLYSSLIAGLGGSLARFDFNLESEDLK